jgi:hypothetical protein
MASGCIFCLIVYLFFPQSVHVASVSCVDDLDVVFFEKMESVSGCKLPFALKMKIARLIEEHSFNCGLSLKLDVKSLGNVSKEFQVMFAKMMKHMCSIDVITKDLVLEIMKAIAETDPNVDDSGVSVYDSTSQRVGVVGSGSAPEQVDVRYAKVLLVYFFCSYLFSSFLFDLNTFFLLFRLQSTLLFLPHQNVLKRKLFLLFLIMYAYVFSLICILIILLFFISFFCFRFIWLIWRTICLR